MKICFVVDGRSPIAVNWIKHFIARGHEAHLVSLYPCQPNLQLASLQVFPVAFSRASGGGQAEFGNDRRWRRLSRTALTPRLRTAIRQWLVPTTLPRAARALAAHLEDLQPDLVHAMRLPYEGMLAALADPGPPLLISIWGNDFTLHAPKTPVLARLTRQAMQRTDALHTDCLRDWHLAPQWGFSPDKPSIVLPTGGGVDTGVFYPPESAGAGRDLTLINPRGLRAYVQNQPFFRAVPLILARFPGARFLCTGMAGEPRPERWVRRLGLQKAVTLLPRLSQTELAKRFREAAIAVSLTTHDGTPNSLLEAMSSGCFPVAGDLESVREWIQPGENGLLVAPLQPEAIAEALSTALADTALRQRASENNLSMVMERADRRRVMPEAEAFYQSLI